MVVTDMNPARYSRADYAGALRRLLPRGRVWTREDSGTQAAVLDALANTPATVDRDALTLIAGSFPATADALLPEWNASLALPDPCFGPFDSDDENRLQIVARLIGTGGQSIDYFRALAATLGYTITITEFAVHHVMRTVTAPLADTDWAHGWLVDVISAPPPRWNTVADTVDNPLSDWGTSPTLTMIECLLRRYAPAQSVVAFSHH
ncbi:YmfQ family protein [Paraburkholderia sp. 35.1]|uniref:YmfQ family protein n=1 Tax=Paraburkholderia sp. 35.1 TaxID=2991058 RepID=UPI003D1A9993